MTQAELFLFWEPGTVEHIYAGVSDEEFNRIAVDNYSYRHTDGVLYVAVPEPIDFLAPKEMQP